VKFTVNGKARELPGAPTVGDYLRHLGVNPLSVAVEMNGAIVKRDQFDSTAIPEDGRLEVVRMMGGG
jgi:sulfur carrier protein